MRHTLSQPVEMTQDQIRAIAIHVRDGCRRRKKQCRVSSGENAVEALILTRIGTGVESSELLEHACLERGIGGDNIVYRAGQAGRQET